MLDRLGKPRVLNLNPLVVVVEGFATDAECAAARAAATGRLDRARVVTGAFAEEVSDRRTNSTAVVDHRTHPVLAGLALRISLALRLPFGQAEKMQVLRYAPGEQFADHLDGFIFGNEGDATERARGGQRLFTSLVYLNDVEAGGETDFPGLGLTVLPKKRSLLIFANTDAGSDRVAELSRHAGRPVTAGEKWVATLWWRERLSEKGAV